jgi:hypothetical protein
MGDADRSSFFAQRIRANGRTCGLLLLFAEYPTPIIIGKVILMGAEALTRRHRPS